MSTVQERREKIMDLLLDRERVTVAELVTTFDVSVMTVYRDLDALEDRGILRKVRGGATALPTASYESSLGYRLTEMRAAKDRIAKAAASRIPAGSSVALDDSTTTLALVPYLAEIPHLTIVTYFASVVEAVSRLTEGTLRLIVVGGTYNPKYHSFGGVLAEQGLKQFRVDFAYVSVPAVDVREGAFHQEPEQAALKRTMTEIADHSTLLADSSKFAKRALHRVAALDAFDEIIVDASTERATVEALSRACSHLEVAS